MKVFLQWLLGLAGLLTVVEAFEITAVKAGWRRMSAAEYLELAGHGPGVLVSWRADWWFIVLVWSLGAGMLLGFWSWVRRGARTAS